MKTGEALIEDVSKTFIVEPLNYEPPVEKVPIPRIPGRFIPILPNVDKNKLIAVDNETDLPGCSKSSIEEVENSSNEVTFDVTAAQEADIKSEPIQDEDFTGNNNVDDEFTNIVTDGPTDTLTGDNTIEVKTEIENDEASSLNADLSDKTVGKTKMTMMNVVNSTEIPILYSKNVKSESTNSNWRVDSQVTDMNGSGRVTYRKCSESRLGC